MDVHTEYHVGQKVAIKIDGGMVGGIIQEITIRVNEDGITGIAYKGKAVWQDHKKIIYKRDFLASQEELREYERTRVPKQS